MADATFVEVLRPFVAERTLESGEIVDASDWRLLSRLIDQRYVQLVAAPDDTPAAPKRARRNNP